jgi:hypothetical protein
MLAANCTIAGSLGSTGRSSSSFSGDGLSDDSRLRTIAALPDARSVLRSAFIGELLLVRSGMVLLLELFAPNNARELLYSRAFSFVIRDYVRRLSLGTTTWLRLRCDGSTCLEYSDVIHVDEVSRTLVARRAGVHRSQFAALDPGDDFVSGDAPRCRKLRWCPFALMKKPSQVCACKGYRTFD